MMTNTYSHQDEFPIINELMIVIKQSHIMLKYGIISLQYGDISHKTDYIL